MAFSRLAGAALAALALVPHVVSSSANPIVRTSYGHIMGATSEFREGVSTFKGIPYAEPPVGDLRWRPPVKPAPWGSEVLNATAFGNQCIQTFSNINQSIWTNMYLPVSEDCLYLNVWTSNLDLDAKQPVFLWMHGGRFWDGSGEVITFDGSGLAAEGIVVVTINDRLGPLGYLAHPELAAESPHNVSGNYGVMDMIASVEWVRDQIQYFGGDPQKITVGGQSSGSSCALDMFYSPLASGMIAGAIPESGARSPLDPLTGSLATSYRTMDTALAQGQEFIAQFNATTIEEARQITVAELLSGDGMYYLEDDTTFDDTVWYNQSSAFMDPPLFRPVLDGYVLQYTYGDSLKYNAHADVPVLTGNNADESGAMLDPGLTVASYKQFFDQFFSNTNLTSTFYELWPGETDAQANNNSNDFFQVVGRVSSCVQEYASLNSSNGANVYTYYFDHSPPIDSSLVAPNTQGTYHGAEQLYVFNNIPYNYPDAGWTSSDYTVQAQLVQYWVNFIKYGNPNGNGTGSSGNLTYWPASGNDGTTMWLGDSWGADSIATAAKKQFVLDWFVATGYTY
ncbi:alpha/beta-hydrolase [Cryphonectria parasitica EP155]|uniref:Carboxylic ester hydrolase n=1 Tax=Cryphonectria parasitica (strain ATCC 38755 / EP155) TaxID=660469 RepID=A0A9P4XYL2_CRYP1|nr:alpha/beta-hydrolase [Cryphonectria parasitica EP155]KAF3763393.1 alpha/beta-hydrolase [Cryphonectria parasitica EP155]